MAESEAAVRQASRSRQAQRLAGDTLWPQLMPGEAEPNGHETVLKRTILDQFMCPGRLLDVILSIWPFFLYLEEPVDAKRD